MEYEYWTKCGSDPLMQINQKLLTSRTYNYNNVAHSLLKKWFFIVPFGYKSQIIEKFLNPPLI